MTLDGCLSTRLFYGGNHGTEFYEFAFLGINFTQQSIFGSFDFWITVPDEPQPASRRPPSVAAAISRAATG